MTGLAAPLRRKSAVQFAKFVMVGVLNTAFSYSIYAGLLYVGLSFILANLIAVALGIAFSFQTQGRIVFQQSDKGQWIRFVVAWSLIWLFNIALIKLLIELSFNAYWAGALALPPTVLTSFFVQKRFVFVPSRAAPAASTAD